MKIVYIDETGDPGVNIPKGASIGYGLGVVVVDAHDWKATFNKLKDLRRQLRDMHGIPIKAEIKASDLIRNQGWFSGSGVQPWQRRKVFEMHMQFIAANNLQVFATWLDKRAYLDDNDRLKVKEDAWNFTLQRIVKTFPNEKVMLIHDEGDELFVRKLTRRSREYLTAGSSFGTQSLRLDFDNLIDDPVSRKSNESLFIQLSDLVAFAASKSISVPGSRVQRICPSTMWEKLATSRIGAVNGYARSLNPELPIAIVTKKSPALPGTG